MKRPLRPEEARLWLAVAATVRPAHGRTAPEMPAGPETRAAPAGPAPKSAPSSPASFNRPAHRPDPGLAPIEPNRRRRIEHEALDLRLDLHGLDQDQARAALHGFIGRAHEAGARAVLVITGKGVRGDGILRRRAPEWLAEAPSRARVAGVSPAERRHGGEGALYVALKRR